MNELLLTRPDDWHLHLRDGTALQDTAPAVARYMGRAIIMPNLVPPVVDLDAAVAYRARINAAQAHCPRQFEPLMVLYLTPTTRPEEIFTAQASGLIHGVKLYPAGATTHSDAGVSDLAPLDPVFAAMAECGLPLLIHGEVTDPEVDIFDREAVFIKDHLRRIVSRFPQLRIVLEHITTAEAVEFVRSAPDTVAATVTAHHLLHHRNDMLAGGIRPHYYCLPVLKRKRHQQALIEAVLSGDPKFFLGTDSAPHLRPTKESACGCAGIYTAHAALELYAEVFATAGVLHRLEGFASHFGADFYGLPRNREQVLLRRAAWKVPESLPMGEGELVPLAAGEVLNWQVEELE